MTMAYGERFSDNSLDNQLNKKISISGTPEQLGVTNDTGKKTEEVKKGVPYLKEALTMTNSDILEKSKSERLAYITKDFISGDSLVSELKEKGEELKKSPYSITFSFDEKDNSELFLRTTAGQVLPNEIGILVCNNIVYSRANPEGEFFDKNNNRLIIKDNTQIYITEIRDTNDVELKNYEIANSGKYEGNEELVLQALNRGIDPEFALISLSGTNYNIEQKLTEFGRYRGIIKDDGSVDKYGHHSTNLVLILFKLFAPDSWKQNAELYGIDKDAIEEYESSNISKKLSEGKKQEILSKAPEYLKILVKKYFPPEEFENALFVCSGESGFNKNALNKNTDKYSSTDRGLFQINDHYHSTRYEGENIFDPEVNVRIAGEIFKERQSRMPDKAWKDWYAAEKIGLWN